MVNVGSVGYLEKKSKDRSSTPPHAAQGNGKADKPDTSHKGGYKDRFWIPRFWDGIGVVGWFSLLWRNRFAVAPSRIAMALIIAALSFLNSFLWLVQFFVYRRKIDRTRIDYDPIFVIGHWRSGTTLLHELLVRDPRHTYPDTYDCFAPNHFLVSGWWMKPWLQVLLPTQRPIDNMPAGWSHPQEDEFALCNMGLPSPYLTAVFSNRPPQYQEYLDFRGVPPSALNRWKGQFLWFLKCLTLRDPKRIVLKSPPHTARIRVLLEMFPRAKFVHIVRDPQVLFPSTVNLWRRLYRDQGLQVPKCEGLDEQVFQTLTRMYEAFDRDRPLLGKGQFCEVRYEQLVANPLEEMRRVYQELELGDFEAARPGVEAYFTGQKNYRTNRYEITPEIKAEIGRRWKKYAQQYGYDA